MLRVAIAGITALALVGGGVARAQAPTGPSAPRELAILGSVFDTVGAPIADVELAVVGTAVVRRTDGGGEFRLPPLRPARYVLRARRIGYVARDVEVDGSAGDTLTLTLSLTPSAPVLTPVVVEERETAMRHPKLAGFYERMRTAASPPSSFVTRAQIERMNPRHVSDVVKSRGPRAAACLGGKVYVDGVLSTSPATLAALQNAFIRQARREGRRDVADRMRPGRVRPEDAVDFIPPNEVEAIEIYRSGAQAPVEYNKTANPGEAGGCVILIWTR